MKTIFKGKLLLVVAGVVAVVAVACASPEPPTATPKPPNDELPVEMANPPEMNEPTEEMQPATNNPQMDYPLIFTPTATLALDDPNYRAYQGCRAYIFRVANTLPESMRHELANEFGLDNVFDFCEVAYNEMFPLPLFSSTTPLRTKDEAPYPLGTIPTSAVDKWENDLRVLRERFDLELLFPFCSAVVTEFIDGYVKNQLIVSFDNELDDPVETISAMLSAAGLQFDRIEVFTAEDYAHYDSSSFINFLAPSRNYSKFVALRENFGFTLNDASVEAFKSFFLDTGEIMGRTFRISDDGKVRYQVKIYAENDLNLGQLEALNVGETIRFGHFSSSACPRVFNSTLYYFAGGIWTTFGDDLVWFIDPSCRSMRNPVCWHRR